MNRIEKLKEFLLQDPADSFVQHALALEYIKEGQEADAKELLESLLLRDPGYIGSYYHIAKLCERSGDVEGAVKWYGKGMEEAQNAGDNHAYSELKSAYEEFTF
jgi:Tfp pilus assembly protein PilF